MCACVHVCVCVCVCLHVTVCDFMNVVCNDKSLIFSLMGVN